MLTGWTPNQIRLKSSRTNSMRSGVRERLRQRHGDWQLSLPQGVVTPQFEDLPSIIAVGGGKGGVGKSLFSANLAARLGVNGYNVLLVDLDWGGANLHTYFGLGIPKTTLTKFREFNLDSFDSLALRTPATRVSLVAGGNNESWLGELDQNILPSLWTAILNTRRDMKMDIVILDLGAGIQKQTIDFFAGAHLGLVTVLPEPTSIENAYSFLKAVSLNLIERVGDHMGCIALARAIGKALISQSNKNVRLLGHRERLRHLASEHTEFVSACVRSLLGRSLGIVLNQTRSHRDVEIGKSMEHICGQYFGFETTFLGHLNYDEVAWKALRNQRLLVADFPHSLLAKRIADVSARTLEVLDLRVRG